MDVLDRLPDWTDRGAHLKQDLQDRLVEHRRYIQLNGQDLPEIRNWKWGVTAT
jgi:xylulose-5-phosphate/fructose-6-phosphate phosphoketolase